MAEKQRVTATPIKPLSERSAAEREVAAALAAEIAAAQLADPEAAAAALEHVSADMLPPEFRLPDEQVPVEEQPNPDDDGRMLREIDERRLESVRQAEVRKDAVAKHISEIDADANHPLRGAATRARVPFGSRSQRLAAPRREGFHRHWFNEVPGRIETALRAGYKIVKDVDGKLMKRVVGVGQNNDAMYAYYMEIPIEWYVQDMRASRKSADDLEQTIRAGKLGSVEKQYVPKSGIEYEHETGGSYLPRQ